MAILRAAKRILYVLFRTQIYPRGVKTKIRKKVSRDRQHIERREEKDIRMPGRLVGGGLISPSPSKEWIGSFAADFSDPKPFFSSAPCSTAGRHRKKGLSRSPTHCGEGGRKDSRMPGRSRKILCHAIANTLREERRKISGCRVGWWVVD